MFQTTLRTPSTALAFQKRSKSGRGVTAQYESEAVYHSIREDLEDQGVLFLDMDSGLKEHSDIVKKYFGTVIPYSDNKFSALNTAVWSGGLFLGMSQRRPCRDAGSSLFGSMPKTWAN